MSLRWRDSWRKKDCGSSPEKMCCRIEKGESKEEGDVIREYKAMHEENFLSSRLRENGKNREEIMGEVGKETEEETSKKRIREEERDENETVVSILIRLRLLYF